MTNIEWADETWSPVVGCSTVNEGCRNCYAIRECYRMGCNPNPTMRANYGGLVTPDGKNWTGVVRLLTDRLDRPALWKSPKLVFVNPMADLFHEEIPPSWLVEISDVMEVWDRHIYVILTKRWERMESMCSNIPPNMLLGVSVHDQASFNAAWPYLRETPAEGGGRVVSYEPALGPLVLPEDALTGARRLAWVICGGESGKLARRMDPEWARDLLDQCVDAGIPFFFKQWGEWGTAALERVGKKAAGRVLDGRTWDERPKLVGWRRTTTSGFRICR